MNTLPQWRQAFLAMYEGKRLTSLSALFDHGIISFPKRVCEMRKNGCIIQQRTIKTPTGKRVNEYWIENK